MAERRWKPLPMAAPSRTAGGLPRALLDAGGGRRRRALLRATLVLALAAVPACAGWVAGRGPAAAARAAAAGEDASAVAAGEDASAAAAGEHAR